MEGQNKQENMSKNDEWFLVEEKIYPLQSFQEDIPKEKREKRLPVATGANSNGETRKNMASASLGEHFQHNEVKNTSRRPKELISIDNVSLVTARQGNKLPYGRTISAPLPQSSPSRISPSSVSPGRNPHSAPPQMVPVFRWPSIQEQPNPEGESMATNGTKDGMHVPHPPLQRVQPGEEKTPAFHRKYKELNIRQVGRELAENSPILPQDCLLARRRLKSSKTHTFTHLSMEQNSRSPTSFPLRDTDIKSEEDRNGSQYSESNIGQGLSVLHQDDKSEKKATKATGRQGDSLPPITGSQSPKALIHSQQMAVGLQHTTESVAKEEKNSCNDMAVHISQSKSEQALPLEEIKPGESSPSKAVVQLVAQTQKFTLNDAVESPALKERRKLARTLRKKFGR